MRVIVTSNMSTLWTLVFAAVILGRICHAVVVLEHREVTLSCDISPGVEKTSAVFWYSNALYKYLTRDAEVISDIRDEAPMLYQRLSVVSSVTGGKYNLRISDVRGEDAGDYICGYYRGANEWITVKTETLEVLAPPGIEFPACSVQSPGDTLLLPGMLVNLSCITYGGSPRADLVWYRAGVLLTSVTAHGGLWVYHQRRILEEDSGVEFTCEATSSALVEPKRCSIVPYRRAPLLSIQHTHGGLVNVRSSATFTCASKDETGNVGAHYQWYIDGIPAEDARLGIIAADGGKYLTFLNISSTDDKIVVSCEKVDEFTTRSSASLTIRVVYPVYPMLTKVELTPSEQPGPGISTSAASQQLNLTQVGFVASIAGAIFCGMFFMLLLILLIRLLCTCARKRERLDISTKHETAVGWRKIAEVSYDGTKNNHVTINVDKPPEKTPVLTFRRPNGAIANGNLSLSHCAECNAERKASTAGTPCCKTSPKRLAENREPRHTASEDPLLSHNHRKRPPPLSLPNETRKPLLSSPSPTNRDCAASMPDLASRHFGESKSSLYHDYVNLPALPSSKEYFESSTPSPHHNSKIISPHAPTNHQNPTRPAFGSQQKSISYAELDLPSVGHYRPPTPRSPHSPQTTQPRSGSVSAERTKYAEIAYVFRDRRQQSLPSVKLVGLSEGFGETV